MLLVKLGGAAITNKTQLETLNDPVLRATSRELADALTASPRPCVVVHGCGSFGHQQARAAGIAEGGLAPGRRDKQLGFARTRRSATLLNNLVVGALIDAGLPAVGLPAFGSWDTDGDAIVHDGLRAVAEAQRAGLLPVLHGDSVLDARQGCRILSGDTIMRRLVEAPSLGPATVVFLTNVAGVFSCPPDEPGAELVARIDVEPDGSWQARDAAGGMLGVRHDCAEHDVSGGMATKVAEAASIAQLGVAVRIAQAGTPAAAVACRPEALPDDWVGTQVLPVGGV